jgi:hypothetical protein
MTSTVFFTSSDSFMESDPRACESAEVSVDEYVEGTYNSLRHAEGIEFATLINGAWELSDGRRFSDWAVRVS